MSSGQSPHLSAAEQILRDLGISTPEEIDIEMIAWHRGAKVKYRRLDDCEARIVGNGDSAIITVDNRFGPARVRFSVGHELGHWHHHRGRSLICRSEDIEKGSNAGPLNPERIADAYSADLLLPNYLLQPMIRGLAKLTWEEIGKVADAFSASLTATGIKLVETGPVPSLLVCHSKVGRRWFTRHRDVPWRWFPRDDMDADSLAFEVLHGTISRSRRAKIGADAWFDRLDAPKFDIFEESTKINREALTVLTIEDEEMLEEEDAPRRR